MRNIVLYGPWVDDGILEIVIGNGFRGARSVDIAGVVEWDPMTGAARIRSAAGFVVQGRAMELADAQWTRLCHYVAALGAVWVPAGLGGADADILMPQAGQSTKMAGFDACSPPYLSHAVAAVVMDLFPMPDPETLAGRRAQILAQASARLRAGATVAPAALRRSTQSADLRIARKTQPYRAFFAVEEVDFSHKRFLGGHSATVRRAVFVSGDAVTVLPYDPRRDRVLLVEQVRSGPLVRGDQNPWQLEAVAGRIDPGEAPQDAALREAVEEAGLTLAVENLIAIAQYYPSPGTSAEMLYSYLALADLPDGAAGFFGLDSEDEDIRGHLIGCAQLMDLVASGEISNAPTILSAFWLARERGRLRE